MARAQAWIKLITPSSCCVPAELQAELAAIRIAIHDNTHQMNRIDETLEVDVMTGREMEHRADRLTETVQVTKETLNRMMSKTMAQELLTSSAAGAERGQLAAATGPLGLKQGNLAEKASDVRKSSIVKFNVTLCSHGGRLQVIHRRTTPCCEPRWLISMCWPRFRYAKSATTNGAWRKSNGLPWTCW